MKKIFEYLIASAILLGAAYYHYLNQGPELVFEVREGQSGASVASELKKSGVISSTLWFKTVLKISDSAKKIKAGHFILRKGMSSEEVIWRFLNTDGNFYVKITIPEGWRAEQVAERLEANSITSMSEFMKVVRVRKLEGQLFPSTYLLQRNMKGEEVVDIMKKEFDRQIGPLLRRGSFPAGLTAEQVLVVASIVEREAVVHSERPLIAAVYINRIKKKMKLEADPTVQYAVGYNKKEDTWWKKRTLFSDLRIDSPYNTYKYEGLPPLPIANPGVESVRAVLSPAGFDALYFVADQMSQHVFNSNYNDHLRAIKRINQTKKENK